MSRYHQILTLLTPALTLTACSSPFVKGWNRPGTQAAESATQEECLQDTTRVWHEGRCVAKSSLDLSIARSQAQCELPGDDRYVWDQERCVSRQDIKDDETCGLGQRLGWSWIAERCVSSGEKACLAQPEHVYLSDGSCTTKPTVKATTSHLLDQSIIPGQALVPIPLEASPGAEVALAEETCPGVLVVQGTSVTVPAGAKKPAGVNTCQAQLIAKKGNARSAPLSVKVTFVEGFQALCKGKERSPSLRKTLTAIFQALETTGCDDTADKLAKAKSLNLSGQEIEDLSPLQGLAQLARLDLANNKITDLSPLATLPGLRYLDVRGNSVATLAPLARLTALDIFVADPNLLGQTAERTAENCPAADGVAGAIREWCQSQ